MTTVGDPSLLAVEKSGKNYGPVDLNLCLVVFVLSLLLQARLSNLPNELVAFEIRLLLLSLACLINRQDVVFHE